MKNIPKPLIIPPMPKVKKPKINNKKEIWVVVAENEGEEPLVTVFNAKYCALSCREAFAHYFDKCYVVKTVLFKRI